MDGSSAKYLGFGILIQVLKTDSGSIFEMQWCGRNNTGKQKQYWKVISLMKKKWIHVH